MARDDSTPDAPETGPALSGVTDTPPDVKDDQDEDGQKVVRVHEPTGSFDPSIEGVPVITQEGVLLSKDQIAQVRSAANDAGVTISARKE